ncbi:hypothetical protein Tco_0795310 [Tanacetum coccineum]
MGCDGSGWLRGQPAIAIRTGEGVGLWVHSRKGALVCGFEISTEEGAGWFGLSAGGQGCVVLAVGTAGSVGTAVRVCWVRIRVSQRVGLGCGSAVEGTMARDSREYVWF